MSERSLNYAFTDFQKTDWGNMFADNNEIFRYIGRGKEVCPKTNREHLQGFIQLTTRRTWTGLMRVLKQKGFTGHLEMCRQSAKINIDYCRKCENYESWGDISTQGQRHDITDLTSAIQRNISVEAIMDEFPAEYLRFGRGIERMVSVQEKRNRGLFRRINVTLHTGATGTGKTRSVYSDDCYMITGDSLEWWDGYEGQIKLVIDEYANQCKITKLLNLLDGYKLRLPIKGGFTYANWTEVHITTNLPELHENAKEEHRAALYRRITEVKYYDEIDAGSDE